MALNPVVAFGLAMGAAASIIVYLRHKDIKEAVMAFVKVFLATGTPLHFIMVGIYLGSQVNRLIYRRVSVSTVVTAEGAIIDLNQKISHNRL